MQRTILSVVITLALTACNAGSDDLNEPAAIAGDASGPGTVSANQRSADGSFTPAAEEQPTDADGHYVLILDGDVEAGTTFIVSWVGEDRSTGEVLVTATASSDGTVSAPDIDEQTGAEAAVFAALSAQGTTDAEGAALSSRLLVDADIAATMASSSSADDAAGSAAVGVGSAGAALHAAFADEAQGAADLLVSMYAEADSEAAGDGAWSGGTSADLTLGTLLDTCDEQAMWSDASASIAVHAAAEAAAALGQADGSLDSVEAALLATLSAERQDRSTSVVAEAMASLGVAASQSEAAGAALSGEIEGALDLLVGGGVATGVDTALAAAWSDYDAAVLADLSASLSGPEVALVAQALDLAVVLRSETQSQVDAAAASGDAEATGETTWSAMSAFAVDAHAQVAALLVVGGTLGEADAALIATVVVELAANGSAG